MDSAAQPAQPQPEDLKENSPVTEKAAASATVTRISGRIPGSIKKDARGVWRSATHFINRHRWASLAATLAVLATAWWIIHPHDYEWLRAIKKNRSEALQTLADQIAFWGDFAQYNLAFAVGLWLLGKFRKSRYLQRLAMATVISATLAGMVCNAYRFTMGRPRPRTDAIDKFYGPMPSSGYQGFPSGHTATAFGTATPVLVACPQIGVPLTIFAGGVGWARMYQKAHYPSDVLVGGFIGIFFGVACGIPLRRLRKRGRAMEKAKVAAGG